MRYARALLPTVVLGLVPAAGAAHESRVMEDRLSGTQGSVRRRELRPCTATFAKSG